MFWRKKKKQKYADDPPSYNGKSICKEKGHVYKDFPPYLTYDISGDHSAEVVEVYACGRCGDIQRKVLERVVFANAIATQNGIQKIEKQYEDMLKPAAIVNDMIYDYIFLYKEKEEEPDVPSITIGPPKTLPH